MYIYTAKEIEISKFRYLKWYGDVYGSYCGNYNGSYYGIYMVVVLGVCGACNF